MRGEINWASETQLVAQIMDKNEYQEYLLSEHWQQFSRRVKLDRLRCEKCGIDTADAMKRDRQGLNVHHTTYDRIGRELQQDVELLCYVCHMGKHGKGDWLKLCLSKSMPPIANADFVRCANCGKSSRYRVYGPDEIFEWICLECAA